MSGLKLVGAAWIAAATLSIAMTLVFRVDTSQIVVTIALALLTLGFGVWLLVRPRDPGLLASLVTGVAWLVVYAGLAILQSDEIAAWVTDAGLAVIGVGIALFAWKSQGSATARGPETVADMGSTR